MLSASGWAADPDALADFLAEPNLARMGTLDEPGEPHVVPVWFWWDGVSFWIGSQASDAKIANIRRTGRASVEVDGDVRRKKGLLARGAARLVEGPAARTEYARITAEQLRRYKPDKPPLETAQAWAEKGEPVVIEVRPDSIVSWGR